MLVLFIWWLIHLIAPPTSSGQFFFNEKYAYKKISPQRSPLKQQPLGLVPEMVAIRGSTVQAITDACLKIVALEIYSAKETRESLVGIFKNTVAVVVH